MLNNFFEGEDGKRAAKWIKLSFIFLTIFLIAESVTVFKRLPNAGREVYPQSTITVSGMGEAYAVPDIATFNFSVVEEGSTVADAQSKSDKKIASALAVLKEAGIEDKDIKTSNYNAYPKYEWSQPQCIAYPCPAGKNVLTGYEVNQTITVKVRETDKAGDLVTKVGNLGVSNISGIDFTVDDRDMYVNQAREEAISKAKDQAKKLASDLGVHLGRVLYYNDNSNYPIYYGEMGMGGGDMMKTSSVAPAPAQLPGGESKITSNVSITYEIR